MKHVLLTLLVFCSTTYAHAQSDIVQGVVTSQLNGEPLVGVNVIIKGTTKGVVTDANGAFNILCSPEDVLIFSYIGYESEEVKVGSRSTIDIALTEGLEMLSAIEIYSTGYQEIPPERATGSFTQVSQELVNRSVSTDIISRLEGITAGLLFDKRLAGDTYGDGFRSLRIRGVNSIEADNSPLIVVDNFPYEGDINNINPNDVQNITVLKDAAAASIWGARASNGVIVITTKKGNFNQPFQVSINSNITIAEKPDLHYSPDFLPSSDFIGFEREMFERGYYNSRENSTYKAALSPVVELLILQRDGLISSTVLEESLNRLSQQDVRDEAENHFFRNSIKQQYAINMRGGSGKVQYYLSGGFDQDLSSIDGKGMDRITLVSNNSFRPVEKLEVTIGLNYANKKQLINGIGWGTVATRFPYATFIDAEGTYLPVINNLRQTYIENVEEEGLLDWQYRPLQEKALYDNTVTSKELRINTGINYKLPHNFQINLKYQYQNIGSNQRSLQDKDSYYVRHQVNRFTQADGTRVFPYGDVLSESFNNQDAHSGRAQLSYNNPIGEKHHLSGIAGAEVRQVYVAQSGFQVFGYDDDVLTYQNSFDYTARYPVRPRGSTFLPRPSLDLGDLTDRYISYFSNLSYTYNGKYILSASARWDASNLFGVKTNQKGVPLWSMGGSWDISEEGFYSSSMLPYLRLRATYGYNGNIDKSLTAYPTGQYGTDFYTNLPTVSIRTPGNPQLRWEKVGILNLGLDFESRNQRISGSIEWYNKHGKDIIAEAPVDPTTGFITEVNIQNKLNSAETTTRGIDIQLQTVNTNGTIRWSTNFLFSSVKNKVLDFYNESIDINTIFAGIGGNVSILPQEGRPIDGLYSLPWYGLDPNTGDPLVVYEDQPGTDYVNYLVNFEFEDLIYHGENVPTIFGAVRNDFTWKGLTLSANISYKAGYYFRRSSINYSNLMGNWAGHKDYNDRWQASGDELTTQVPSLPSSPNNFRDVIYLGSELLVEKGDHIRLEDINLSYSFDPQSISWLKLQELRVFVFANNLGILWRANDKGLDPDYPSASYTPPKTIAFGFNATF